MKSQPHTAHLKPPTQDVKGTIELRRTQSVVGLGGDSLKKSFGRFYW